MNLLHKQADVPQLQELDAPVTKEYDAVRWVYQQYLDNRIQSLSWQDFQKKFQQMAQRYPKVWMEVRQNRPHITTADMERWMDEYKPQEQSYELEHATYRDPDTSYRDAEQLVLRINQSADASRILAQDPLLAQWVDYVGQSSEMSNHPATRKTVGWLRVDFVDEDWLLVDEVQSDLVNSVAQAKLIFEADSFDDFMASLRSDKIREKVVEKGITAQNFQQAKQRMLQEGYNLESMEEIKRKLIRLFENWAEYGIASLIELARRHGIKNVAIHTAETIATRDEAVEGEKVHMYYDQLAKSFGFHKQQVDTGDLRGNFWVRTAAKKKSSEEDYYMKEGCGIWAVDDARRHGGEIYILSRDGGEEWGEDILYEITHAFVKRDGKTFDIRGERSLKQMADEFGAVSFSIKGPWSPDAFEAKFMGDTDDKPLYGKVAAKFYPATDEWINRAKSFLKEKWAERHRELGREGGPTGLLGACKFASLFAQALFGGQIRGNPDHQLLKTPDRIIDLTDLWDQEAFYHDKEFFGNPEHAESVASCEPRVRQWVEEFDQRYGISKTADWRKALKQFPNLGGEIPKAGPIPEGQQFAAIRTSDGQIFADPHWMNNTHVSFIWEMGIPPDKVEDGGWLIDGVYEPTDRSDAGKYGGRARAMLNTLRALKAEGKIAGFNKKADTDILVENEGGSAYGDVMRPEEWEISEWLAQPDRDLRRISGALKKYGKIAVLFGVEIDKWENRGKGYGNKLLNLFESEARSLGAEAILLLADNKGRQLKGFDLVAWYKKHGFRVLDEGGYFGVVMLKAPLWENRNVAKKIPRKRKMLVDDPKLYAEVRSDPRQTSMLGKPHEDELQDVYAKPKNLFKASLLKGASQAPVSAESIRLALEKTLTDQPVKVVNGSPENMVLWVGDPTDESEVAWRAHERLLADMGFAWDGDSMKIAETFYNEATGQKLTLDFSSQHPKTSNEKMPVDEKTDIRRGWRGEHERYKIVDPNATATEGIGLYVAKTRAFARFFGKVRPVYYRTPKKPLIVREEPLYLFSDEGDPFSPIESSDSEWTKLNKQALINTHVTESDWRVGDAAQELTKLMREKGYDAVDITSGGEGWMVLLDPSLYEGVGPGSKQANFAWSM